MKRILVILVMFVAVNANAQWVSSDLPLMGNINQLNYINKTDIYANQSYTYFPNPQASATTLRLYKSNNSGISWSLLFSYNGQQYQSVEMSNTSFLNSSYGIFCFYSSSSSVIYRTTNSGINWNSFSIPYSGFYSTKCKYLNDSTIIVLANSGGPNYQVFKTTNLGITWSFVGLPTSEYMNNMYFKDQSNGYISSQSGKIYRSTDSGSSWNTINTGIQSNIVDISFINSLTGFAAGNTNSGSLIFKSTNEGNTWSVINTFGLEYFSSISCQNSSVIYVSGINKLLKSIDSGNNWSQILSFSNAGNTYISCYNKDTLVVSKSNTIYRSNNGGTYIVINNQIIPDNYSLSQNYPNPFNPTTNIKFSIVKTGQAKLIVYDVQGREVQTLVNERLQPGTYEASFDGSALNTGVYFYKLITGTFSETKKMLLIK